MRLRFDGKEVIVTGDGSGIGEATVRRFPDDGASVVVGNVRAEAIARALGEMDDDRHLGVVAT